MCHVCCSFILTALIACGHACLPLGQHLLHGRSPVPRERRWGFRARFGARETRRPLAGSHFLRIGAALVIRRMIMIWWQILLIGVTLASKILKSPYLTKFVWLRWIKWRALPISNLTKKFESVLQFWERNYARFLIYNGTFDSGFHEQGETSLGNLRLLGKGMWDKK